MLIFMLSDTYVSTRSTDDAYDNALAESINGLYKAEVAGKTAEKWGAQRLHGKAVKILSGC